MRKDKYDKDYDGIMAKRYGILVVNLYFVILFVVYKVGAFFGIW